MMNQETYRLPLIRLANTVSVVFHPLFLPFYGLLIIFYSPTVLSFLPFEVKKFTLLVFASFGLLIPLSVTPFLISRGILTSWKMEKKSDRSITLFLITVLYASMAFMVHKWYIPGFLKAFFYTLPALSFVLLLINNWYHISLHAAGTGSFTALLILLSFRMSAPLFPFVTVAVLLSGTVISSRLLLGSHTEGQVYTGFAAGFFIAALLLSVLQ